MKKTFLLLAVAATLAFTASAQEKVQFGVKAGVAIPNMTVSAFGISASGDAKVSYYVGGIANIPVSPIFSVQPGLTLSNKGTKGTVTSGEEVEVGSDARINVTYIEIPVNLVANFKAGNAGKVFIGAGPYYALGIDANAKSGKVKEDIKFGEDFKRGDFGLNFLGGYQFNTGFNIHAGYGLGLSNTLIDSEGFKFKHRVFTVGLGYNFN